MKSKIKSANVRRGFAIGIIVLAGMLLYGMAMAFHGMTIDNLWLIAGGSTVIALFSGITLWRAWARLTGCDRLWLNYIVSVVIETAVLMDIFYGINHLLADKETETEQAVIERLYSETRHRTRRISHRTYAQGEPYKVYSADVRFESGKKKSMSMQYARWKRLHKGDTLTFKVSRGGLGMPVIRRDDLPSDVPESSYARQFRHRQE